MTEEQVKKLFDEYTRFNTEANRATIGIGLGMTIAKRLVDMMNGNIVAESVLDKGSVFTVHIPQKRRGTSVCGPDLSAKLQDFQFHSTTVLKKTQREYMPYGKVLVVDDVESNLYVIKGMLDLYNLHIDTSHSGFEAIEKIKNGNVYDIVFMDHMMPKMDGIEAVRIIREIGYMNSIVALTANALIGRAEMFLQNGFDGYISKPIDSRELDIILNDFIRNKKPPEVVEAARAEQYKKQQQGNTASTKTSEVEKFFIKDAESAITILENFMEDRNNIDAEKMQLFITTVHGIKTALANIGEKELSGIALKLEQAGKDRNIEVMSSETTILINGLISLVAKLKPLWENKGLSVSGRDLNLLREKMLEIKAACTTLDKNTVKSTLNDLRQKDWPNQIMAIFDEIAVHILHSDFDKAAEAAENAIGKC
jgi:CheY-like chemotaxis protein